MISNFCHAMSASAIDILIRLDALTTQQIRKKCVTSKSLRTYKSKTKFINKHFSPPKLELSGKKFRLKNNHLNSYSIRF